jgi:UDP-3-O-[3-hydroxymyristoyl] glucosamine N-acyltransferase
MTLSELADRLGRPIAGEGGPDPDKTVVRGISTIDEGTATEISFVINPKYAERAQSSDVAALLVPEGLAIPGKWTIPLADLHEGILAVIRLFHPEKEFDPGVDPSAVVHETAELGEGVSIQPGAVIEAHVEIGPRTVIEAGVFLGEGTSVGADCHLSPRSVVMRDCRLGDRVILQPGAVIGADGFKYLPMGGRHVKIPQIGRVVIGDDVEIGANTCVDRASFTETRIGRGTKIDNLTQIGHNCRIGEDCIVVAQVGIGGSVTVGDRTVIAGQVGIADNIEIGSDVMIAAKSGVRKNVPDGVGVFGVPALPQREAMRLAGHVNRLPQAMAELRRLCGRVEALETEPEVEEP